MERLEGARSRPFMVWQDREFSYAWLRHAVEQWRALLPKQRIGPGQIVALCGNYSPHTCAALLALVENRNVSVPLATTTPARQAEFQDIANVQVSITFAAADAWTVHHTGRRVDNPLLLSLIAAGAPGLVLFSSGSTGQSKAALHNCHKLLQKFRRPRRALRTLVFLSLDHIGGINTLFHTLANTGTIVTVASRSPAAVCAAIEKWRVELLPVTPTFLQLLLLSEQQRRFDLSSLQLITYGTEVMPAYLLRRLHAELSHVQLKQTYGLSEVGILPSRSRDGTSLWVKVGGEGYETRVVDGTLWIRAAAAMEGYLNASSPFTADGWLNTGDAVEQDGKWLRILGRQSEIINVGGEKVYPQEVENVLLQMPNVKDVTVYGEQHPLTGQIVVACFNLLAPEEPVAFKRRLRAFCAPRLEPFKIPVKVVTVDEAQYGARFKKWRPPGD